MNAAFKEIEANYWAEGEQVRFYFNNPALIVAAVFKRKTGSDSMMIAAADHSRAGASSKTGMQLASISTALRYDKFYFDCKTGEVCVQRSATYNPDQALADKWAPHIVAEITARSTEA